MIEKNKGAIGIREFVAIIFMIIGLKHTDLTVTLLFSKGQNAAWIITFLGGIISFFAIFILLRLLKQYEGFNLIDLIYHLFGKYLGFFVGIILLLITLLATAIDSRSYADIINTLYLRKTPLIIIYLFFLGASLYIAKRGLQAIGRIASIMTPIIIGITIIIFILLYKDIKLDYLFPILGPGIKTLLKEGFLKSSLFGDIIMLTAIYPYLRNEKSYRIGTYVGFGITWFVLIAFLILYNILFSHPSAENITYTFHEAIRFIDLSTSLTNNEIFFFAFWLYTSLIRFSVYLYVLAVLFGYIFRIKEYEPLLVPLAFIGFLIGLLPNNPVIYELKIRSNFILTPASFAFFILPILLWITAKWKGELKR